MGIYRGAGGSGDAVNDASSEALITIQARDAALAAQVAAEAAQTAAELAETNAETAETNAETAETNAETAATNAASSASAASTSASNAATSATNAANSATAAQTAETNAETAETNAAASASAASTSASNAATSATNASNSASAASTSATNASNSASAAATSATNAANSATAAQTAQTAAELAETNAETAETNAETAETNAAASASAAATSASNASTSASNAATSATNASNSASAAATSATNASNSASAASTSASNAATSESNAATSATNAAASYDSFDDRYLGAKSSAPTLDNDGNALLTGALYFNTSTNEMKVWSGSAWLNAYASLSGALLASNNLSDLNNTATARTNLGVAIGTNVQAWDADLDTWATKTAPSGTVVGTSDSQTLTNKTIALGSNTVSGTLAQFNTAVTDADLASIAGTETLTNKTLTSPTINTATISGGTINNAAIGGTTPAAGSFTSLTDSGNLTFTGTGNRITGDFNSTTVANRVAFQTSNSNQGTILSVIPNGTSQTAGLTFETDSAVTTGSTLQTVVIGGSEARVASGIRGAGSYLPLTMFTGGSERLRIDTSGNVGIGTSSPAYKLDVSGSGRVTTSLAAGGAPTGYGVLQAVSDDANTSPRQISIRGTTNANKNLFLGFNTTSDYGAIQALIDGTGYVSLALNPQGGNVGIGTGSPSISDFNANARVLHGFLNTTDGFFYKAQSSSATTVFGAGDNAAFLYTTSSDPLLFGTNVTERMRIDSSGNVGIGNSNPTNAKVMIGTDLGVITTAARILSVGHSSGGVLILGKDNSDYSYLQHEAASQISQWLYRGGVGVTLTSSGNVGIGTSSPAARLDARGAIYAGDGTNSLQIGAGWGGTATQCYVATGGASTQMIFGLNGSERMRITSGGNVGIGTSSPSGELHVGSTTAGIGDTDVYIQSPSTDRPRLRLWSGTTDKLELSVGSTAEINAVSSIPMTFFTNNTERMRITSGGDLQFNSGYGSVATAYGCRAWVNFNGTGTVSIRKSGNVSSITDNGVGDYTVNFTTAMPDADYSFGFGIDDDGFNDAAAYHVKGLTWNASSLRIRTAFAWNTNAAFADFGICTLQFFR